jgi:GMP synthase (glutamine-hydrolysing)
MSISNLEILIVDPFVQEPAMNCTNRLSSLLKSRIKIFYPSLFSAEKMLELKPDAVLVLGSASHVTQNLPWQSELARSLDHFLNKEIPVLGLCFGHQLMAHFYGCEVDYFKTPEDREKGQRSLEMETEFGLLKKGDILELAVTHRQAVLKLSNQFENLGHGPRPYLTHDLIRHRTLPFIGCQAHPEASEHFCLKSAEVDHKEIPRIQNSGDRLILSFFKEYF